MPTVLSVTMAIRSHSLSQQGAITKRMTAIEEMASMDVLCSDKTSTLTLNKLTVDKNLIEIGRFSRKVTTRMLWCFMLQEPQGWKTKMPLMHQLLTCLMIPKRHVPGSTRFTSYRSIQSANALPSPT